MLRPLNFEDTPPVCIKLADANPDSLFKSGLEYSAPARGTWNIVHIGMLIPQSHQIFVCASNCLRGVVLTAAEMNASDRFSTVEITEENVLNGDMEDLIIEGVSQILSELDPLPPAVLVFTSCIHHFMGCDLKYCYNILRKRFPDVDFTDCYMNPIMRKSGLNPDRMMRRQMYSLLKPADSDGGVNLIGNCFATDEQSELTGLIRSSGRVLRDITLAKTYAEYKDMAKSALNIYTNPSAHAAAQYMKDRLMQDYLYLPLCYGFNEISRNNAALADALGVEWQCDEPLRKKAEKALSELKNTLREIPVAIDYTATTRPFGLARLLLESGIAVARIYADSVSDEEREDFAFLKNNAPQIDIYPTVDAAMRVEDRNFEGKILAVGQKAAYFTGTKHFVNIVEGGGLYGFEGIVKLCSLMREALDAERDASEFIQQKGLGCECCL